MEYRAATTKDLAKIFRHNDDRLSVEYITAGYTIRQAKDIFTDSVKNGKAHTLLCNDRPLAVIAWDIIDKKIYTSFAATSEFFDQKYILFCRRHIRTIQQQNSNYTVIATSYGNHHHIRRWFELLGFELGLPEGVATRYNLAPR